MLKWICYVRPEDPKWNYIISLEGPRDDFTVRNAPVKRKPVSLTSDDFSLPAKVDSRKSSHRGGLVNCNADDGA